MTTYHAFGDSLSASFSPSSGLYVNQVADNFGWTVNNHAVSGNMAADQSFLCYGITPSSNDVFSVAVGTNDAGWYGSDTNKRDYGFIPFHLGLVAWPALPSKVTARSTAMTLSGAWTNTSFNSVGKYNSSPTIGDAASCYVSGTTVYVFGAIENHSASEALATVKIDGVSVANIETRGTLVGNTQAGRSYSLACWRFGFLSSGSHHVQIILANAKCFFLDAVAGSDQPFYPPVYVSDVPRRHPLLTFDGVTETYSKAILTNAHYLYADGLNIAPFYASRAVDVVMDTYSDGVHWNESGQNNVAQELINAI